MTTDTDRADLAARLRAEAQEWGMEAGDHQERWAQEMRTRADLLNEAADVIDPDHERAEAMRSFIFQALGAASMCWDERPTGVFRSEHALMIGRDVAAVVLDGAPLPDWYQAVGAGAEDAE